MNLGLGNLSELKTQLLAASLRDAADYDATLAALGRGVAALFETRCRRKFGRTVGDVYETNAARTHLILPRYPVEVITKIEVRESLGDGWTESGLVADVVENYSAESGLVLFSSAPSSLPSARVRLTYSGGYWFDETEPTDEGHPAAMPEGATARPADLFHAWLLQCEYVWKLHDKLGTEIAGGSGGPELVSLSLAGVQLVPAVVETLRDYVRYSLT